MNSYWPVTLLSGAMGGFFKGLGRVAANGHPRAERKFHFKMREMNSPERLVNSPERLERVRLFYQVIEKYVISYFYKQRELFSTKLPLDQKVDFIFDDRSEKKFILTAWDEIVSKQDDDVQKHFGATPRFENDQDFLPLQGADLWAWWVREWYEEDSHDFPDKLRDFNFGKWRGKERSNIAMSASEDNIFDLLQHVMADNFVDGNWVRTSADGTSRFGSEES